jgi:DNA polymerase-3 subunit alpha/error-prone DNA polymerase
MYFGTWIDAEGEFFDTAHFSDSLQKYPPFKVEVVICY